MSLIALLSLSSTTAAHSPAKLLDVYERVPLQAKLRRNAHGALKPQQLHFKLYGTNTKSRYRSLLAGFSIDVVEHFDRLRALNETAPSTPRRPIDALPVSQTSAYSSRGYASSLPVRLTATDGLYAPQSSLSLFMDSLHFLPAASSLVSWRRTPVTMNSDSNSPSASKPVDRQIELVAMPSRTNSRATVRLPSRSRRSSSTSRSPRTKQSELRRASRANAQLSAALMNKKLREASPRTLGATTTSQAMDIIGYEIDEQELADRFYTELRSNDSRETTSDASTPPLSPSQQLELRSMDEGVNASENEWKAKQLALEQQVAALIAENETKTALIKYLMDENSRIVGDCECGNAVSTVSEQQHQQTGDEIQHSRTCASNGRVQASESLSSQPAAAQVSPIPVPEVKRKFLETGVHSQQPLAAKETLFFEDLVSDIESEFSQLFSCERSTVAEESGSTAT